MIKPLKLKINISKDIGEVSALLMLPEDVKALVVLSHGAGAGMEHPFMESLSLNLADHKIGTLRFNFAYMEKGSGPPDRPKKAYAVIQAAVQKALKYSKSIPLLAGGKSFGGRMTSLLAAEGELKEIKGIVYFGFPLHAPGRPGIERAAHLSEVVIPQLFLQGTRDTLAKVDLIQEVCRQLPQGQLVIIEGGDHSFKMLKRSGVSHEEAIAQLAEATARFVNNL